MRKMKNVLIRFLTSPQAIIDLHTCIQGEGKYAGIPHILIRMSGCNMNCQFRDNICDTSYASWKPEANKYSLKDVHDFILKQSRIKHIMITGGEPTYNLPLLAGILNIIEDCEEGATSSYFVTLETNGSISIPASEEYKKIDFLSFSPKLSNSVPVLGTSIKDNFVEGEITPEHIKRHEKERSKSRAMVSQTIQNLYSVNATLDSQLKFVISVEEDLLEVKEFLFGNGSFTPNKVWLMPEGINLEQLEKRRGWLIEKCIEEGYNYSDRLHILAYGNKREA